MAVGRGTGFLTIQIDPKIPELSCFLESLVRKGAQDEGLLVAPILVSFPIAYFGEERSPRRGQWGRSVRAVL
jgi:hypothetical protein